MTTVGTTYKRQPMAISGAIYFLGKKPIKLMNSETLPKRNILLSRRMTEKTSNGIMNLSLRPVEINCFGSSSGGPFAFLDIIVFSVSCSFTIVSRFAPCFSGQQNLSHPSSNTPSLYGLTVLTT